MFSSSSERWRTALRTVSSSLSRLSGFSRKSYAPRFVHSTAVCTSPCPETMTTGELMRCSLRFSRTSIPSSTGILMSSRIASYGTFAALSSPSCPDRASSILYPSYSRVIRIASRIAVSSSMISTRYGIQPRLSCMSPARLYAQRCAREARRFPTSRRGRRRSQAFGTPPSSAAGPAASSPPPSARMRAPCLSTSPVN